MCLPVRMTASGRMQSFEGIWTPAGGRALEGLGRGFAANHFDVVPVRTNDEGCTQSEPDCVELSSPRAPEAAGRGYVHAARTRSLCWLGQFRCAGHLMRRKFRD